MKTLSVDRSTRVEEFVLHHQRGLRSFLVFLGCPAAMLDDLVQDVFLSVLATGFEERNPASTRAFLRRVAKNLFLKAIQKERRDQRLSELEAAEQAWVRFEADDEGDAYLRALRDCLGRLRGRARDVLRLRYEQRRQRTEIAREIGISEAGVKSVLVRAKKQLRECVEGKLSG